jgi:hypothetical protein
VTENRDETTGQFAPAEPLTGRESVEQAQGYTPYEPPATDPSTEDTGPVTVAEAAEELSASRTPEADIKRYGTSLDDLDPSVSITPEQAAELTTREKQAELKAAEEKAQATLRAEVDKTRSIEAEKSLPPEVKAMIETGVDPDVAQALQKPQVREAIEQEFGRADQVREQYTSGLEQARIASLATLAEVVPHLAGLDPARFEEGLAVLQQVDPPAFQQAMNVLQRTNQIVQAQQQAQQYQTQIAHQRFEEFGKAEDARFRQMLGNDQGKIKEAATEVVSYLEELGIGQDRLVHLLRTDPTIRSAEGQRILADAAKYRQMQKAPKAVAAKPLPPVQRPGTSNQASASSPSAKLASLEKSLETATGDRAARISAEIHGLQRRARG